MTTMNCETCKHEIYDKRNQFPCRNCYDDWGTPSEWELKEKEVTEEIIDMTKELVRISDSNVPVTDSLIVAEAFGKRHDNVIRDIKNLMEKDVLNFEEISIPDSYGRDRKAYEMDEEAFMTLVMGFTGDKAIRFRNKFVQAFLKMRDYLREKATPVMSQIEMIAGIANGMVDQQKEIVQIKENVGAVDKRVDSVIRDTASALQHVVKDTDSKIENVTTESKETKAKVEELDHKFNTKGCKPGHIPFGSAFRRYRRGLSKNVFTTFLEVIGHPMDTYMHR